MEVIRLVFEQQDNNAERLKHGPELRSKHERILAEIGAPVILDIGATSLFFAAMGRSPKRIRGPSR